MTGTANEISVLVAALLDPAAGRIDMKVPEGDTIAEIVYSALPGLTSANLSQCRVSLVNERGVIFVDHTQWRLVRPKPGAHVVIRMIPAKSALKSILQIVVAIAAVALGQYWALGLGFAAGTTGFALASGLIGVGVWNHGDLQINSLMPPAFRSGT